MIRRPQVRLPRRTTQQEAQPVHQGDLVDNLPHRPQTNRPPRRTTQQGASPVYQGDMPHRSQTHRPPRRTTQQEAPPVHQGNSADNLPHRPQTHRPPRRTTQQEAPPVYQGDMPHRPQTHRPPRRTTQQEAPPVFQGDFAENMPHRPQTRRPPRRTTQEAPPVYQGVFGDISSIWFSHNDDALLARAYATQNRPPPIPQGIFGNSRWSKILPIRPEEYPQVPLVNRVATQEAPPVSQGVFGNISAIWFTENDDALLARANATQNRPPPIPQGIFKHSRWSKVLPAKVYPQVPLLDNVRSNEGSRPLPNEGRVHQAVWPHITQVGSTPNVSPIQESRDVDMEDTSDQMDTDPPVFPPCPLTLTLGVPEAMDVDTTVIPLIFPPTLPIPMDVDEPSDKDKSPLGDGVQTITLWKSTVDLDFNKSDSIPDDGDYPTVVLCDPIPSNTVDEESLPLDLPDRPDLPDVVDDLQPESDQMEQLTECFRHLDVCDDDAPGKATSIPTTPVQASSRYVPNFEWLVEPIFPPSPLVSYTNILAECRARKSSRILSSEIDETSEGSISPGLSDGPDDTSTSTVSLQPASPCLDILEPHMLRTSTPRVSFSENSKETCSRIPKSRRNRSVQHQKPWFNEWDSTMGTEHPFDDTSRTPEKIENIQVTNHYIPHSRSSKSRRTTSPEHILHRRQPESCAPMMDDSLRISDPKSNGDPVFPGAYALEDEYPPSHYPYWRSLSKWILGELMCGW